MKTQNLYLMIASIIAILSIAPLCLNLADVNIALLATAGIAFGYSVQTFLVNAEMKNDKTQWGFLGLQVVTSMIISVYFREERDTLKSSLFLLGLIISSVGVMVHAAIQEVAAEKEMKRLAKAKVTHPALNNHEVVAKAETLMHESTLMKERKPVEVQRTFHAV